MRKGEGGLLVGEGVRGGGGVWRPKKCNFFGDVVFE